MSQDPMLDGAPKHRHRAVAQHGCVSDETEEQVDALTMLGDKADGVRSLLARPGSELALAEPPTALTRRVSRLVASSRPMTLDGRRWSYRHLFLLKCLQARFLCHFSELGMVAE